MEALPAVLSIAGAIALGAMSPGPSFVLVARTSAARSRGEGLAMALAMGGGGVIFAVLALLGVHVVLATVPLLYAVLKLAGGAYLVYLGWAMWRHAAAPLALKDAPAACSPATRRWRSRCRRWSSARASPSSSSS